MQYYTKPRSSIAKHFPSMTFFMALCNVRPLFQTLAPSACAAPSYIRAHFTPQRGKPWHHSVAQSVFYMLWRGTGLVSKVNSILFWQIEPKYDCTLSPNIGFCETSFLSNCFFFFFKSNFLIHCKRVLFKKYAAVSLRCIYKLFIC